MFSLYIHIPFCKRKCPYCDFYSQLSLADVDYYLEVLERELQLYRERFCGDLVSIYLGGGTPSLLSIRAIERLLNAIAKTFTIIHACEITLECNPEQASESYYSDLQILGINRLSIGIQSLDDRILHFLGRGHTATEAKRAITLAHKVGFKRISTDIIYGIPTQTVAELEVTLRGLRDIEHISAYHLTIEENTFFGRMYARGKLYEVEESISEEHFALCHEYLQNAGYEHYEVSSYARGRGYSIHNMGYWCARPYLGLGASAHSYDGERLRWWNPQNLKTYYERVANGVCFVDAERLTDEELWEEWLLTGLRTQWGVCLTEGVSRFSQQKIGELEKKARPLLQAQLLKQKAGRLYIPPEKFILADQVIRTLS
ncbi:MAG: radical SAM family heme chaperone HemW [Bacteroides sp.]